MTDPYAAYGGTTTAPVQPPAADPYAAYGGTKAAQPSAQPTTTPASAQPGGGFGGMVTQAEEAARQNASQMPSVSPGTQGVMQLISGPGARAVGSGIKDTGEFLGGLIDQFRKLSAPQKSRFDIDYLVQHPQASQAERDTAFEQARQQYANDNVQKAADWLRQGDEPHGIAEWVGKIGSQMLQYAGPEAWLKLAGGAAKAGKAVEAVEGTTNAATQVMKNGHKLMETLSENPTAAGYMALGIRTAQAAGKAFMKNAALSGGVEYLHTEDPQQAARAAAIGGGLAGGMEAGAGALTAGMRAIAEGPVGRYLMRKGPQIVERLGQEFPVLASQLNKAGRLLQGNVESEAPDIYAAQQAALPGAIQNLAQRAATNAIEEINAGRPVFDAAPSGAPLLPAPEGATGFTFTRGTTPTTETPTGQMVQQAAKVPGRAAFKEPQYTTASAPNPDLLRQPIYGQPGMEGPVPRGVSPIATEGQMGADIRSARVPEAGGETVGGGAAQQTKDPRQAVQWATDLEAMQRTPEFAKLPAAEQQAVRDQAKAINDQLELYYESPYVQRFGKEDLPGMLGKIRTFGDLGDQLDHAAKPVYNVIDRASGGKFSEWRSIYNRNRNILANPSSEEAAQNAMQKMKEAEGNINQLFEDHRGQVTFDDYLAAKNTYRQSVRAHEMDALFEGMMNGITDTEATKSGMTRLMDRGNVKRFETYLRDGTNRQQIEGMFGHDGIVNLKEMTGLFMDAKSNREVQSVATRISQFLLKHTALPVAGGFMAHTAGMPAYWGMAAGYMGAAGVRGVLREAAMNPRVGSMLMWAATHDVDPKIYTPLIARAIIAPMEERKKPEGQGQEEPVPAAAQ